MAEMSLYPEYLKDLNLSFAECIYAIAFGLDDEIREQGKEAVFKNLGMTPEEMDRRVKYCLDEKMYKHCAYALRRVLGDLDSAANDKKMFGTWTTLDKSFDEARKVLCSSEVYVTIRGVHENYRSLLIEGAQSNASSEVISKTPIMKDGCATEIYAEVQRLMSEVRFYNEKRDQALVRIEELMAEIQRRKDCPDDFGMNGFNPGVCEIDLDGTITQVRWPYRSLKVLQGLGLKTLNEVVEFFQNFDNFVKGEEITLLEWSVITMVLRKEGMPLTEGCGLSLNYSIDEMGFTARAHACLRRGGIYDIDDFSIAFAHGAQHGWSKLKHLRQLGRVTFMEVVQRLGEIWIELDDSACFPTTTSSIRALDFDYDARLRLSRLNIETVEELLKCYLDTNRFTGLRYVDIDLYAATEVQLTKYGFLDDN